VSGNECLEWQLIRGKRRVLTMMLEFIIYVDTMLLQYCLRSGQMCVIMMICICITHIETHILSDVDKYRVTLCLSLSLCK
jgi:hypothetical protein